MTNNPNEFWQSCELCDSNLKFKNVKILETHRLTHPEYLETVVLSDDLKDYCKTECKICEKLTSLSILTAHVISIDTYYQMIYGLLDIVEKFYHKCKLCEKIILLDADDGKNHLQHKHEYTQVLDYNKMYMIYSTQQKKKKDYNIQKNIINHEFIDNLIETLQIDKFPSNWKLMEDLNADVCAHVFSYADDELFNQN